MAAPRHTLVGAAEIAAALNVSVRTVRRRVKDGTVPATKIGGRRTSPLRISRKAIDKLLGD